MTKSQWGIGAAMLVLLAVAAWLMPGLSAQVGDAAKKPKENKEVKTPGAPTVKAEKKPFRVEVEVNGTLEAADCAEIAFYREPMLDSPSLPLTIAKIAEHGSQIKKGDCVVAFDMVRLEQTLQNLHVEKKVLDSTI